MNPTTDHSCSYHCDRPECIKAQRDEMRERLKQIDAQEPVAWMFSVREKDGSIREFAAIDYYIQPHDLKIISKIPLYTKPEAK